MAGRLTAISPIVLGTSTPAFYHTQRRVTYLHGRQYGSDRSALTELQFGRADIKLVNLTTDPSFLPVSDNRHAGSPRRRCRHDDRKWSTSSWAVTRVLERHDAFVGDRLDLDKHFGADVGHAGPVELFHQLLQQR